MDFTQQISILLREGVAKNGRSLSTHEIAQAAGIPRQTLDNLLSGRSTNPRLFTLRAIGTVFDVTLAYFDCLTPEACRAHLRAKRMATMTATVQQIANAADTLSSDGHHNVLTIMAWMEAAQ